MNNKGFTLVEIISVIALLALVVIISVPAISKTSENIKKKTLQTKIENIEQAAILYGQEHRENFTESCKESGDPCKNIDGECYCYALTYSRTDGSGNVSIKKIETIPVSKLLNPSIELTTEDGYKETNVNPEEKGYLEPDDEDGNIFNSVNETELNNCKIQIYQKYGKIYAVYDTVTDKANCFYIEN